MDPGEGRHQPCVICSIASTTSAPCFGDREISYRVHIRRPLRPCIFHANGHMVSTFRYRNTDISSCVRPARGFRPLALPSEAEMARGPDPMPPAIGLEAEDPRDRMIEVVQGHLVRRDRRVPVRRARVEAIDPHPSLALRDADHAIRALVQLTSAGPAAVQLR